MNQDQVREFHEFFGQPSRHTPTFISLEETYLRRALLNEEFHEADEAMEEGEDLQHIAKELADVMYVAYGAAIHYGIDLDRVFDEVAKSNMSKLWTCGCRDVTRSGNVVEQLTKDPNLNYFCSACGGTGKVSRLRSDGKVLKPDTYQLPDLSFIPNKQRMAVINGE